jgi:hypothetical protein
MPSTRYTSFHFDKKALLSSVVEKQYEKSEKKVLQLIVTQFSMFHHCMYVVHYVVQFLIDSEESVFYFKQVSGVVKANSRVTLTIKFIPSAPLNFYRRVTCLIHNMVSITVKSLLGDQPVGPNISGRIRQMAV